MKDGIERRRHPRAPLALQAILKTPKGPIIGKTADISVSGLAVILLKTKPEVGDEFEVALKSSEGHEMSLTCKKIWSGEMISDEAVYNAIGVKFTKISPGDREIISEMVKGYYLTLNSENDS